MFNVACKLSQPMGKIQFSSTAENRTNTVYLLPDVSLENNNTWNVNGALFCRIPP